LTEYLKGCDVVIHAATQLPLRAREIRDWEPTNRLRMEGTSRLIEAALRAGVGYYIQQSTVSAYINGGEQWLDENTPFDISPARAVMTLAVADMERRVREIPVQEMQWSILRIGQLVGPGTTEVSLARDLEEGRAVVSGNGKHFFSPVHIVDAASAFVQAARRRIGQRVLNITDEPIRFGDYLDHLADRLRVTRPHRDPTQAKVLSQRCTNEAARKALDWVPYWGLHLDEKIRIGV